MRSADDETVGPTHSQEGPFRRRRWERRRASDKVAMIALLAGGMAILIAAAVSVMVITNSVNIEDVRGVQQQTESEAQMRRDQSCVLFERSHLADVNQLSDTYRYLLSLSPQELRNPLNQFILASLPEVEQQAHVDTAPRYCDAPGVGLPEPDPVVPDRPKELEGKDRLP